MRLVLDSKFSVLAEIGHSDSKQATRGQNRPVPAPATGLAVNGSEPSIHCRIILACRPFGTTKDGLGLTPARAEAVFLQQLREFPWTPPKRYLWDRLLSAEGQY
jgi:hypothetical protein